MQLFDKCLTQLRASDRETFRSIAHDAICVSGDVIWHHIKTAGTVQPADFPFAIPPWKHAFIEFGGRDGSSGVLCKTYEAAEREMLRHKRSDMAAKIASSHTIIRFLMYVEVNGKGVERMPLGCLGFLDSSGCAAGGWDNLDWFADSQEVLKKCFEIEDGIIFRKLLLHVIAALATFTFANCSNVKLDDVTEELQPPAKIRRRLKLPEVKRYTLNIAGHSTTPRRGSTGDQTGIMPFHLCRGHFATYTAEKPMFGNPKLVGRYWHPPHTRGKKERGEIIKDYAMKEHSDAE